MGVLELRRMPTGRTTTDQIVQWLDEEPAVRLVFQPGTVQIAQGVEALGESTAARRS